MFNSGRVKEYKNNHTHLKFKSSSSSFYKSPSVLDRIFNNFVSTYPFDKQKLLHLKKEIILETVRSNLGIKNKKQYSAEELKAIENGLPQTIYIVGKRLMDLKESETKLEPPTTLQKNAANLVKHLMFGVPAVEDKTDLLESHLLCAESIKAVSEEHNPLFLKAIREQFQHYLGRLAEPFIESKPSSKKLDTQDEIQFISFIHNLLGFYTLLEPEKDEIFFLPKKMGTRWQLVEYQFNRIDISPQKDVVAKLLVDEKDRVYAYTLTATKLHCESYLLFSGTTFGVGQGAPLSILSTLKPGYSCGEPHDMTEVRKWIHAQTQKIIVAGHSQGGVLAMITAARYMKHIKAAFCFNPSALSKKTLARYLPIWNRTIEKNKPEIIVYTQQYDPIFIVEKGFLPGTTIYKIIPDHEKPAINGSLKLKWNKLSLPIPHALFEKVVKHYEAHVHFYTGHQQVLMVKLDVNRENARLWREVTADAKLAVTSIVHPIARLSFLSYLYSKKNSVSPLQKKVAFSTLALMCATLLKTSMKHPRLAFGGLALLALVLIIVPQIESEVVYQKARNAR